MDPISHEKNNGRKFESTYVIAIVGKKSFCEEALIYIKDNLKNLEGLKSMYLCN